MLGVPRRDWDLLFRWTNEVIAPEDPEFQREGSIEATLDGARLELFQYFDAMSRDRRANPRDDIVSVVANGEVERAAAARRSSCSPTTCCWWSPATRPRATR